MPRLAQLTAHPHSRICLSILLSLCAITIAPLHGQQVPTFEQVNGFAIGERLVRHRDSKDYLEALAEASNRVTVETIGMSWEGRELMLATVTSPANHARLEQILAGNRALDDARTTSPDQAQSLTASHPVTVLFTGTIHGFELSPTEGLMRLIERLATADDSETLAVLDNAVILIQPIANPDGRDAFVNENHARIGRTPNSSRADWNNDYTSFEALRYRTTHYFFDPNRDWFANTQPETRAIAEAIRRFRPQVAVDVHEMGTDNSFYFDPPAKPYGLTPQYALDWYEKFGAAHAAAFDRAGFEYFGRDFYNYFYPGYSEAYNNLQGAVGMLYEQGAPRGLAIERRDGSVLTMADASLHQYTAAWAALELATRERQQLLADYHRSARAAVEDVDQTAYVVRTDTEDFASDANLVEELVGLLQRHGVEVERTEQAVQVGAASGRFGADLAQTEIPAGSLVIQSSQPRSALLRSLLEPSLPMEGEFLEMAREKIDRDLNPRFYDVTAWSLPQLFDLDLIRIDGNTLNKAGSAPIADRGRRQLRRPPVDSPYAYVFPGQQTASRAAAWHLRNQGFRVSFLTGDTVIDSLNIHSGSVVIRVGHNQQEIHQAVREVADRFHLDLDSVSTGWSPEGILNLGAPDITVPLAPSNIALVTEDPVLALSFGFAWYLLDQQYQIPTTVVRARSLGDTDLSEFDVLVIPELSDRKEMVEIMGESGASRLEQWIRDGGTVVALGNAVELVREDLELIDLSSFYDLESQSSSENEQNENGGNSENSEKDIAGAESRSRNENEKAPIRRFDVPGAVYEASVDGWQWLAAGYNDSMPFMVTSDRLYRAPDRPPSSAHRVVVRIDEGAKLQAGFAWPESQERLPGSVLVYEQRIGSGRVIAFAEDPNFRGFWRGADRLFLNAVVVGPSAP